MTGVTALRDRDVPNFENGWLAGSDKEVTAQLLSIMAWMVIASTIE